MTEIQKDQTFSAPPARCLEGLLRVGPYVEMKVKRSDAAAGTAELNWEPGGAAFVFRLSCTDAGSGQTQVQLQHDLAWTPVLSRPVVNSERMRQQLDERVRVQMERIFTTLEEFLQDETRFPKGVTPTSLEIDHLAWAAGGAISVGLRWLAAQLQPVLARSVGRGQFLRAVGLAGILVGAAAAGLLKRRNPSRGSAFFEGLIVVIVNIWMSLFIYQKVFSLGVVDWVISALVGLTAGWLASMRLPARKEK